MKTTLIAPAAGAVRHLTRTHIDFQSIFNQGLDAEKLNHSIMNPEAGHFVEPECTDRVWWGSKPTLSDLVHDNHEREQALEIDMGTWRPPEDPTIWVPEVPQSDDPTLSNLHDDQPDDASIRLAHSCEIDIEVSSEKGIRIKYKCADASGSDITESLGEDLIA